jgi:hypothetical protein
LRILGLVELNGLIPTGRVELVNLPPKQGQRTPARAEQNPLATPSDVKMCGVREPHSPYIRKVNALRPLFKQVRQF